MTCTPAVDEHNQLENLRTACFGIGYTFSVERRQEIVAPAVIDSHGVDDKVLLNAEVAGIRKGENVH